MKLRRWESWAVYRRAGRKVAERRLRRHFTRRGAEHWSESVTNDPRVIEMSLQSVLRTRQGGPMLLVDPEVRHVA